MPRTYGNYRIMADATAQTAEELIKQNVGRWREWAIAGTVSPWRPAPCDAREVSHIAHNMPKYAVALAAAMAVRMVLLVWEEWAATVTPTLLEVPLRKLELCENPLIDLPLERRRLHALRNIEVPEQFRDTGGKVIFDFGRIVHRPEDALEFSRSDRHTNDSEWRDVRPALPAHHVWLAADRALNVAIGYHDRDDALEGVVGHCMSALLRPGVPHAREAAEDFTARWWSLVSQRLWPDHFAP